MRVRLDTWHPSTKSLSTLLVVLLEEGKVVQTD